MNLSLTKIRFIQDWAVYAAVLNLIIIGWTQSFHNPFLIPAPIIVIAYLYRWVISISIIAIHQLCFYALLPFNRVGAYNFANKFSVKIIF